MYIGKYLIFIVGMTAAIASMFGFSYLNQKNNEKNNQTEPVAQSPVVDARQPATPASPFSVAEPSPEVPAETEIEVETIDTAALLERIENAESRIEELELELAEVQVQQFVPVDAPTESEQTELLSSVFEPAVVSEIQTIRSDIQLQRLDLRDRAIREGWINTDRFREESRALRSGSRLRETLGDDGYDNLLVAEGRDNRVRIDSVIENSAAQVSGIEVGDLVIRYADERIFEFRDLRNGTTAGERDETIAIQVSRDGELIDLVIPRGPMGVTLTGVTEQPLP